MGVAVAVEEMDVAGAEDDEDRKSWNAAACSAGSSRAPVLRALR